MHTYTRARARVHMYAKRKEFDTKYLVIRLHVCARTHIYIYMHIGEILQYSCYHKTERKRLDVRMIYRVALS